MKIEQAVENMKNSLVWGSWNESQADAIRTLLLEVEKAKMLEEENTHLRDKLCKSNEVEISVKSTKKKIYTITVQKEDEDVDMDYELTEDEFLLIKEISEDVERYSLGKCGGISITELKQ